MRPEPMIPDARPDRLRSALRLAAGLALLAFFAVAATPLLLDPNQGESLAAPAQTPSVVVATASNNSGLSSQLAAAQVIETFEVFGGKNPFERPAVFPTGASRFDETTTTAVPGGATATTTPTGDGGADGETGDGATTTDGQTDSTTSTTTPVQVDPVRNQAVALVEVFDDGGTVTATVKVGSTVYRVTEGQDFEGAYRVVSLDLGTGCGSFVYGDSRFDLCEGQEILK